MNDGKICVSVCAETVEELIERIGRAADVADVIELRFDCLRNPDFETVFEALNPVKAAFAGTFLATFRPAEQGGKRTLSLAAREAFWTNPQVAEFADLIDLEHDLPLPAVAGQTGKARPQVVRSFHDFAGTPPDLESVGDRMAAPGEIVKIAVQTDDITDTIAVWKLFEKASKNNRRLIPIAMGEAGKWTRILGPAHGAPLTYAAPDAGAATAPGQLAARELVDVYRVRQLNEDTEIYGVVAGDTSYSMSPYLHNAAFEFHALNAVFVPLQTKNLSAFVRRMIKPETGEIELKFKGFAVTNPHKTEIIKYLDELDEGAREIGAVNTVKIENGRLRGYNTDAHGFIEPLKNTYGGVKDARVAVLGAGGAARACVYALEKEGARVTIFARHPARAAALAKDFQAASKALLRSADHISDNVFKEFDIVVNTTPLGTKGELENETPATAEQLKNVDLAYDLVYNPFQTRFLRAAKQADVPTLGGLAMLVAQAMKQQEIWTGKPGPLREMSRAALSRLR